MLRQLIVVILREVFQRCSVKLFRPSDLPEAYHDAGQFYWLKVESFLDSEKLYVHDAMPVLIPRYLAQAIDTLEDWKTAERMFKSCQWDEIHASEVKSE